MRTYFFIGIGGFAGALARFAVKQAAIFQPGGFPVINTLIANITGCFLLGLFLFLTSETIKFNTDVKLGISVGFLGGYTTFSTMCKEIVQLIHGGHYLTASVYVVVSVALGLGAVYCGKLLSCFVLQRISGKKGQSISGGKGDG